MQAKLDVVVIAEQQAAGLSQRETSEMLEGAGQAAGVWR